MKKKELLRYGMVKMKWAGEEEKFKRKKEKRFSLKRQRREVFRKITWR